MYRLFVLNRNTWNQTTMNCANKQFDKYVLFKKKRNGT